MLQRPSKGMLRFDIGEHFCHLPHEINGLVEREDEISLGVLNPFANLGY